jgi:hypothetical protein
LIPSSGFGRGGFFFGSAAADGVGLLLSDFGPFFSAATTAHVSKMRSKRAEEALAIPARPLRNGSMNSF